MIISISGKMGAGKDLVTEITQFLLSDNKTLVERFENNPEFILKDWKADRNDLSGWKNKKFGLAVKKVVCLLIGCTLEQLEDREFKEKELGEEWNTILYRVATKEGGEIITSFSKENAEIDLEHYSEFYHNGEVYIEEESIIMTPRKLLQLVGTECGRQIIHPNVWVNALMSEYKPTMTHQLVVMDITMKKSPKLIGEALKTGYPNWIISDMRFPNELKTVKEKGGITIRINRKFTAPPKVKIPSYRGQAPKNFKEVDFDENNPLHVKWYNKSFRKEDHHPSETALDDAAFNYVINNNGTIPELVEKVKSILVEEKILKE